ncbi:MAG: Uma2 family endonuclease [Gemmatimonadetes bacterium]|nr:MAG: Uma2 family endonuclease [Gemmatimonadota bacterium]
MPAEDAYVPRMPQLMTAEELLYTNVPNKRTELVRGRLIVHEPPGGRHGNITAMLGARLWQHVDLTAAGALFVGDTGFTLSRNPDTVRGPDIAFVHRERVPDPIPSTFLEFAPDLVVEILSPTDRPGEVLAKVGEWLDAGARLVWVIDPERRLARIYRADGTEQVLEETGRLLGEDILPGFSCPLASILSK